MRRGPLWEETYMGRIPIWEGNLNVVAGEGPHAGKGPRWGRTQHRKGTQYGRDPDGQGPMPGGTQE